MGSAAGTVVDLEVIEGIKPAEAVKKPAPAPTTWEGFGFTPLGVAQSGNPVVFGKVNQAILEISNTKAVVSKLGQVAIYKLGGSKVDKNTGDRTPDYDKAFFNLLEQCSKIGTFWAERFRGPGVWIDEGKVKFHKGDRFEKTSEHYYAADPRGFISPEKGNVLEYAQHFYVELSQAYGKDTASALLGFVVSALAGGSLKWRSHLWLTGPRGVGKTTVWKILSEVFAGHAVDVEGRSSAAGIRQHVKASARPVLVDEAEPGTMRWEGQGLIMLARASSSGAEQVLGTPDGKGCSFRLNSSFCFASINPPAMNAADATRFHIVRLNRHTGGRLPTFKKGFLDRFGQIILHELIHNHDGLIGSIDIAKGKLKGAEERLKDTIGTLIGSAGFVMPKLLEVEALRFNQSAFEQDDAIDMLNKILGAQIKADLSVSMALTGAESLAAEAVGVRVMTNDSGKWVFVANHNEPLKEKAKIQGNYAEVLARLSGAQTSYKARVGGRSARGIAIPWELCDLTEGEKKQCEEQRVPYRNEEPCPF